MGITVTPVGAVISSNNGTTGGAVNLNNVSMGSNVDNGITVISGVQYVVTMTTDGYFHLYQSVDGGVTWSVVGAPVDNSLRVFITGGGAFNNTSGGIAVRGNGGLLYVFYCTQTGVPNTVGSIAGVYYKTYNPVGSIWSAETFAHYPTSFVTDRPNNADVVEVFFRPDSSIAVILEGSAGGTGGEHTGCLIMLFVAGVGTVYKIWGGYGYTGTGNAQWLCTGAGMKSDGTIYMWGSQNDSGATAGGFQVLQFSPSNVASGPVSLPATLNGQALFSGSIGSGDFDGSGNAYAPACIAWGTATQTFIAMAYQSGGTWFATAALDTSQVGYDVLSSPNLKIAGGYLVISMPITPDATGSQQVLWRVGYCLLTAVFTNPANWTWTTVYNFATNTPVIAGTIAPNIVDSFTGVSYSFSQGGDGSSTVRFVATTQENNGTGAVDTIHLFDVVFSGAPVVPTSPNCCCCCYPTNFANQMICSAL